MNRHIPAALMACCIAVYVGQAHAVIAEPMLAAAAQTQASTDAAARNAIRTTIGHYFQGHATGDPAHFRKAFLPTAHVEILRDGKFTSWTLDEYASRFNGKAADDEKKRKRTIDLIDISDYAATAKVTLDYPAIVFTDYFLLLKVDGEWKIANKVAAARPRAPANP